MRNGQTVEERMRHLQRANEVRSWRAQLKRDLAEGRVNPSQLLAANEDRLASMKVVDLLVAVPGIGKVKARKWLGTTGCRAGDTIRVGRLTDRQRTWLIMALRAWERSAERYVARYHPMAREEVAA